MTIVDYECPECGKVQQQIDRVPYLKLDRLCPPCIIERGRQVAIFVNQKEPTIDTSS